MAALSLTEATISLLQGFDIFRLLSCPPSHVVQRMLFERCQSQDASNLSHSWLSGFDTFCRMRTEY
jgi:hypothetical protein